MSWYSRGQDGLQQEQKRRDSLDKPGRVWLPENGKTTVVFLENESFNIYEYRWHANGSWRNWATMSDDTAVIQCFKEKNLNARFAAVYSVIDCSEWIDKQNRPRGYEAKLLVVPDKVAKILQMRKEEQGGLAGKLIKITRLQGKTSCAVGDDFAFLRDAKMDELFKLASYKGTKISDLVNQANESPERMIWFKDKFQLPPLVEGRIPPVLMPFNYEAQLAPPASVKEARLLLTGAADKASAAGVSESDADSKSDDDVPF